MLRLNQKNDDDEEKNQKFSDGFLNIMKNAGAIKSENNISNSINSNNTNSFSQEDSAINPYTGLSNGFTKVLINATGIDKVKKEQEEASNILKNMQKLDEEVQRKKVERQMEKFINDNQANILNDTNNVNNATTTPNYNRRFRVNDNKNEEEINQQIQQAKSQNVQPTNNGNNSIIDNDVKIGLASTTDTQNAQELSISDIKAMQKANETNEAIEKGGIDKFNAQVENFFNSIYGGVKQTISGLANIVTTGAGLGLRGLEGTAKILGLENAGNSLNQAYNSTIETGKNIDEVANYERTVNSQIEDDFTRTTGDVANVISNMVSSQVIGYAIPSSVPGVVVQGLAVGGNSAQEVLNENKDNIMQATLTGIAKGYTSYLTEKMFDANILTRGAKATSIQKSVDKLISDRINSRLGKEIANKTVGILGENVEELVEDNVDNLIDKLINNKDMPGFKEWWNNTKETAKVTTISTLIMSMLGLGGESFHDKEVDMEADYWIDQAQQIIEQEDMAIHFNPSEVKTIDNTKDFYITRFTPEGEIANIVPTRGKTIANPNENLNIKPAIVRDNITNLYNVIDEDTGVVLDSTPYETTMEAEINFNEKVNKLSDLQIRDINQKIGNANYSVNNELSKVISQAKEELSQITPIDYGIQTTENIQENQEQKRQNFENINKTINQISDKSIYNRSAVDNLLNTVSNNISNIEYVPEDNGGGILYSFDDDRNITSQQTIKGKIYSGKKIKNIVNTAIQNADTTSLYQETNTNNTQASQEPNASNFYNNQGNNYTNDTGYAVQDIESVITPFDSQESYSRDELADVWNDKVSDNNYDAYYDENGNIERYIAIEEEGNNIVVNQYDNNDNIVKSEVIPSENGRYNAQDIQDTISRVASLYDENRPIKGQRDIEGNEVLSMKKKSGKTTLSDEQIRNLVKYNPDGREIRDTDYVDFMTERFKDRSNISDIETTTSEVNTLLNETLEEAKNRVGTSEENKIRNKQKELMISKLYSKIKNKRFKVTKNLKSENGNIETKELDIEISKNGLKESFNKSISKEKYAVVPFLDKLIQTSNSGTIRNETKLRQNIDEWYYLYNTAIVDNQLYGVKIDIKKTGQGDRFYVHRLNIIKEGTLSSESIFRDDTIRNNKIPSSTNSIAQKSQSVKNETLPKNNTKNTQEQQKIQKELHNRITNALLSKNTKKNTYLGQVTEKVAKKVKSLLGIDISGRRHIIPDYNIRHIINQHGNPEIEKSKGQIAVTRKDIERIPEILNTYDSIEKGSINTNSMTSNYNESIRYIKKYNNNITYVVEVVPKTGKTLEIKTMWKKPITLTNSKNTPSSTSKTRGNKVKSTLKNEPAGLSHGNNTLPYTSETKSSLGSTNSISQNNQNVKDNGIKAMKNTSRNTSQTTAVDNQGRTLSRQQQEYFKDSKVRDDKGNLLTLYHGSSNQFTIFDQNRAGKSTEDASIGFWFTETREGADKFNRGAWYGNDNSNVYEVYLDIKNPKIYRSIDNSAELEQIDSRLKQNKQRIRDIENNNFAIEVNSSDIRWASDESELQDIARNYGLPDSQINEFVAQSKEYQNLLKEQYNLEKEYENKRYNDAYEQFKNDIYKVVGKTPSDANVGGTGMYIENYSEVVKQYEQNLIDQGYDGIIIEGTKYDSIYFGRNNNQYVAFNSSQIKNVTNTTPTSSQDIRFAKKSAKTPKVEGDILEPGQTNAQRSSNYIEQEIRKIEETGNWDDSIPVTRMTDIRKTIENYLGIGVQKGHFRQQAYGIYKGNRDVIRTKELKDMDTILHETGHALDIGKRIKLDKESISNELLKAVNRYGGYEAETREVKLEEGFAEVIREYTIVPEQARIDYPQTVAVLEGIRQTDKDFNNFITTVQQQTYNYIHQNPRNRGGLSNQSIGERTDKPVWSKEYIKQVAIENAFDSNYALKRATQVLKEKSGNKELRASDNAYVITRLISGIGDKVTSILSDGYIDENGNKLFTGLNQLGEILNNDTERFNDLRAYLVAKRHMDYVSNDLKTGIRTNDARAIIEQFKNDTQIQEASKVVYDTLDGVLQYAVNNKLITEENAQALRESNAFYVPMQRVIGNNGNNVGRKGAVADIIKSRTGSELDIKDVLENIVANSSNIIQQVENNKVLNALYTQGENAGLTGAVYDEISPPMKKVGVARLSVWENELKNQGVDIENIDFDKTMDIFIPNNNIDERNQIVSFIDNRGQRRYLQFHDEILFKELTGLDRESVSKVLTFCNNLNKPLRYGATLANLGFALPNMLSDTVQAYIYSEAGFIPFIDTALGAIDVLTGQSKMFRNFISKVAPEYAERVNTMYELYQQSGATSATKIGQERKSAQNIMKDIYGTKNSKVLGIDDKMAPLKRLLDIMTYIPELSEQSTRFRVFEKNLEYYRKNGMSEIDARMEAALQSRDATQDFSRMGKTMREVNKVIPFSAARVGSIYTFAEKMKANPKRTSARIAVMLALNALIKGLTADDDEINELNQRKKDDNFVFKIGDQVITIKKPQGFLRSLINLNDYIIDLANGNIEEGKEGERLQTWLLNAIMDNSIADDITGMVPSAITPLLENAINKDLYYNSEIVKSYDLELPDSEQYYDYNSQLAIWLGSIFNYSPAKIDNFISGYFAGLGTQVTNIIDWIVGKTGATPEEPNMGLEANSIGKRFFVNVNSNSQSVDDVYTLKTDLTKKKNGGTITSEETEQLEALTEATSNMSKINKQIKEIKKSMTMSADEKAEQIKELQKQKTDIARNALGKDLIYSSSEEAIESIGFYPSRDTLSKNKQTLTMTSDMKKEYEEVANEYYQKYERQGIYSEEKLEQIKTKAKDYAKNYMMKKYKSKLTKSD